MAKDQQKLGIAVIGTLDTKAEEYDFIINRLIALEAHPIVIDASVGPSDPDALIEVDVFRAEEVAARAGSSLAGVRTQERYRALATMAKGASAMIKELADRERIVGTMGVGGSGGTLLLGRAMQGLPLGFPKLIVSSVASGYTRGYIGASDITLVHSVTDVAGLNRFTRQVLDNAAGAIVGMAKSYLRRRHAQILSGKPQTSRELVAATMFGVTTPCVTVIRNRLQTEGYEVAVFHATGVGGDAMEALILQGEIVGVADVTTTEIADEVVGGSMASTVERLCAAVAKGTPQVVSLGALNVVNFGPRETVPFRYDDRTLYEATLSMTLMRTSVEECARIGEVIARRLSDAWSDIAVFIPLRGLSSTGIEGEPFWDPAADKALFASLKDNLRDDIEVVEVDTHINDPLFGRQMADKLIGFMRD